MCNIQNLIIRQSSKSVHKQKKADELKLVLKLCLIILIAQNAALFYIESNLIQCQCELKNVLSFRFVKRFSYSQIMAVMQRNTYVISYLVGNNKLILTQSFIWAWSLFGTVLWLLITIGTWYTTALLIQVYYFSINSNTQISLGNNLLTSLYIVCFCHVWKDEPQGHTFYLPPNPHTTTMLTTNTCSEQLPFLDAKQGRV